MSLESLENFKGNKITLNNSRLKIGKDLKLVRIDGYVRPYGTVTNTYFTFRVYKNNEQTISIRLSPVCTGYEGLAIPSFF